MNGTLLYACAGAALFCIGLYALIIHVHLLRKILACNVMGSGVFLLLVALAQRGGSGNDPLPHALVLTGIVVAVSSTAIALALVCRLTARTGQPVLPEQDG
ncbi:MAG: cation:proton antiporter subunit C [Burkholderiales bacterium]|nr:cation:proton antiporter subunit C [Burkholderiales bacterium]